NLPICPAWPLSFPCPIQPTLPIAQRTLWRLFPSRDPLITNWQRELKDGSPGRICLRHQPSSVSFNNRSADRQTHAQALRLSRIEGVEKAIETLRIQPRTRISHCKQHVGRLSFGQGFILEGAFLQFTGDLSNSLRTYHQLARTLTPSTHGLDGVD